MTVMPYTFDTRTDSASNFEEDIRTYLATRMTTDNINAANGLILAFIDQSVQPPAEGEPLLFDGLIHSVKARINDETGELVLLTLGSVVVPE